MRRCRTQRATSSFDPARSDPPGAPRPLESDTPTRSKGAARSASFAPVAAATFQRRAPAGEGAEPRARAAAHPLTPAGRGEITPPPRVWGVSVSAHGLRGADTRAPGLTPP